MELRIELFADALVLAALFYTIYDNFRTRRQLDKYLDDISWKMVDTKQMLIRCKQFYDEVDEMYRELEQTKQKGENK